MATTWSDTDTAEAKRLRVNTQEKYDVSQRDSQTAGIDPVTGRIWFGVRPLTPLKKEMRADGIDRPPFFVRVGYAHYLRKGGRR